MLCWGLAKCDDRYERIEREREREREREKEKGEHVLSARLDYEDQRPRVFNDWLTDLKGMTTCQGLFYVEMLGNCVHFMSLFTSFALSFFFCFFFVYGYMISVILYNPF